MRKFIEPEITISHFSSESVVTTSAGALSPTTQVLIKMQESQAAQTRVIKFNDLMQIKN